MIRNLFWSNKPTINTGFALNELSLL